MGVLFLDTRGRAIGYQIAFVGTLNRIAVEPRGIFTGAIVAHAASIVIFHNHPSGDPSPSLEDLEFTRTIRDAGAILGVPLTDHLIVGESGRWVSLRQREGW